MLEYLYDYEYNNKMPIKEVVDGYLKIMNYLLDFAIEHNITIPNKLDSYGIVDNFVTNIIEDFSMCINNLNIDNEEYEPNIIFCYIDKLLGTLKLDSLIYENVIRAKCCLLFRSKRYLDGEILMSDYIKKHLNNGYAYVELVDDFMEIGDLDKARYYYDLGMKRKNLKDRVALEERIDYFE